MSPPPGENQSCWTEQLVASVNPSSWTERLAETYAALWKMVIRPPRAEYILSDLGPKRFLVCNRECQRVDLTLRNARGMRLMCSHFVPVHIPDGKTYPCVVYVHGNCSSRLEVLPSVRRLLQRDLTVFCMDLSGSGWSDGEFISLGHFEEQDLSTILDYLRTCSFVSSIGLWGRSMGAVTAILRASEDPDIAACVLDSPFSSLRKVAEELVESKRITLPGFLTGMALQLVRGEVKSRAGFDIDALCPIEKVPKVVVPVLFAVAMDDTFVLPHHTEDLCNAWGGSERTIMHVGGSHNSNRPPWFRDAAATFLERRLTKKADTMSRQFSVNPVKLHSLAVRQTPLENIPLPDRVEPAGDDEMESQSDEHPSAPARWVDDSVLPSRKMKPTEDMVSEGSTEASDSLKNATCQFHSGISEDASYDKLTRWTEL